MHEELRQLVQAQKIDEETAEKVSLLAPGAFVKHRSWGVGKINSWDVLAEKIIIDFENRPGHAMKMQFAVNALLPLPEDHILAQRYDDLPALQTLAQDDPVTLVEKTLRSHGSEMLLDEIDAVLKGVVVSEAKYKGWWDATKKKLRQDQRFVVPSKRNVPMELRGEGVDPAEAMARDVVGAKDYKTKAKAVESILKNAYAFQEPKSQLAEVVKDLDEAAKMSVRLLLSQAVELVLCRMDLETQFEGLELEDSLQLADLLREEKENLQDSLRSLSVARQRQVLEMFPSAYGEDYPEMVCGMLNYSGMRGIGELTRFLFEQGKGDDLLDYLRKGIQQRALDSDVLAWICKERKAKAEKLVDDDLPFVIMANLERDYLSEGTRRANRLSEILQSDPELIQDLIRDSDLNQVRGFVRRLQMSPAFDQLTTNSLLARVIKIHPMAQELVAGGFEQPEDESLIVSWQSLESKQKEFDHLVNVLQPKNREEIKVAREYGDLRENFEYKAAKQQEAVLRRQRAEMERDLDRARGTDFAGADTSRASIGTIVTVEDVATEKEETFCILGAWDSDPSKRVIAYTTGAGQAIIGHQVGDLVELPTAQEDQTRQVKIKEVKAYTSN